MALSTDIELVSPLPNSLQEHPQQTRFEVGDLLISYLEQLGVDYVFGVPGGAIEPLYNALARSDRHGGPRAIVSRHETGAAFMADGYFRQTGKLAVCCATTGPGSTNLITGVASAYENQTPMLVITAQTALANFGRGALQESSCTGVNTVGMFQYCTHYNTLVSHMDQFERKLIAAIMSALQSPSGPAHLSIPLDIMRSGAPVEFPSYDLSKLLHRPSLLDDDAVVELCHSVRRARNAVFVIGEGCDEAISTILEVAKLIDAPIVTIPHGKGLVSPYHPLFRGVIGFAGHSSAREALLAADVDMVLAVGTGLGELASNGWDSNMLLNNRLVHIDPLETHLARSPMAKLHVRGRIITIFQHLLDFLKRKPPINAKLDLAERRRSQSPVRTAPAVQERKLHCRLNEEDKYNDDSTPIKPQRLMHDLTRLFPPNTRYLADNGNSMAWAIHYLHPFDRRVNGQRSAQGGLYRNCLEFASMGWAIGSSVGAALGYRSGPVVCITGDGSLLMSGQELTVAAQESLTVIFVVLNDSALGMVKHGQRLAGAEPIGFELPEIDFAAYARAMGSDGYIIRSPQDLAGLDIDAICRRQGPTLLDVRIDPDEMAPMGVRVKTLGNKV